MSDIVSQLNDLYKLLEHVQMANELTACILCNTGTKQEAIEGIQQGISFYEG